MLRITVPVLALLGSAYLTGCGAGGSDSPANSSRGGGSSVGGGGATGSAGQAGAAGAQALGVSGAAGAVGASGGAGAGAGAGAGGASPAGAGGAGGTTAGSAGSAGASSATAWLFSDDFEAAAIDMTKWTPRITAGATFDLDTSQQHGGKQSLHLKASGFSTMLAAEGAPIFPAPNNTYYGRVWIRVAKDNGANGSVTAGGLTTAHVVWIETGDVTNDTHEVRIGANLGFFQSNLYYQGEVDIRDPAANMTTDAWHCVQFEYGNDLLDVTLDGVHSSISTTNWVAADSVNGNTVAKANWSPTYAAFRIGWELGSGEVWYDDVALDHGPVSCN